MKGKDTMVLNIALNSDMNNILIFLYYYTKQRHVRMSILIQEVLK